MLLKLGSKEYESMVDLKELRKEDKIATLSECFHTKFIEENYIFIKKRNPDNIKVVDEDRDFHLTF